MIVLITSRLLDYDLRFWTKWGEGYDPQAVKRIFNRVFKNNFGNFGHFEVHEKQIIITSSSSSPEGLYTILKNSEKVIINGGMFIFVITSVSVRCGILAQMKCLEVI